MRKREERKNREPRNTPYKYAQQIFDNVQKHLNGEKIFSTIYAGVTGYPQANKPKNLRKI